MEVNKKQNRNQIEILTCKKYAGNTHRWSSKREHCTRSSNSNKSLVATLSRSSFVVLVGERSNGALFNGWSDCTVAVVHAPIDWRLLEIGREKKNPNFNLKITQNNRFYIENSFIWKKNLCGCFCLGLWGIIR